MRNEKMPARELEPGDLVLLGSTERTALLYAKEFIEGRLVLSFIGQGRLGHMGDLAVELDNPDATTTRIIR